MKATSKYDANRRKQAKEGEIVRIGSVYLTDPVDIIKWRALVDLYGSQKVALIEAIHSASFESLRNRMIKQDRDEE